MTKAFETMLYLMRFHGIWPRSNSATYSFRDFMGGSFGILFVTIATVLIIIQIYLLLCQGNTQQFQPDEIILVVEVSFVLYLTIIYFKQINRILPLVEDISNYKYGKPPALNELVKKQNKYTKFIYIYTIIGTCLYGIVSYFDLIECEKTKKFNQFCYYIVPMWLPSKLYNTPYVTYFIIVFETITALSLLLPLTLASYFSACITEFITIRVKHLRLMLRQFSKILPEEEKIAHFVHCIEYHQEIIRLTNIVTNTIGAMNDVEYVTPIIIGGLNFKLFMILSIKDSIHVFGWIFSLGFGCYNGQELINECQALAEDIYDLEWYSLSNRSRYYIGMVLWRTQIPLKMTAGIFYSYSYEFMMRTLQLSYTYTTVLMQIFKRSSS